ncbi:MAG: SufE family protein [Pseudomonadales bacterium]|jgi:cysteine desulfuration protein SufE|nr:SufE family protein [Pseudomonadales bacterium]
MSEAAPFDAVPFGRSIRAEDVEEALAFFDDWEDRYRYIIDLGRELPAMPEALRTEDRYIHGCQSQVWIDHRREPESGHLQFVVDSDALIVRGLAGIVLAALNDRTPEEIEAADIEGFFERIDLLKHLSPTRGNGLRAMVERIRSVAQAPA